MIRRLLAGLFLALLLILAAVPGLCKTIKVDGIEFAVEEDGWYDSMEFVAVYLDTFDKLPDNYLTKKEAQALGWVSREGNLWEVAAQGVRGELTAYLPRLMKVLTDAAEYNPHLTVYPD